MCSVGCESTHTSFLCSPSKRLQLSVCTATENEEKISLVAFGPSRAKVSTDTEK